MKRMLVLAGAGAVACSGGSPPGRTVATVDTIDGIEQLHYGAAPAALLDLAVDTVGVLGDAFAADPYQFDQVSRDGLAGDDAGHLFLLDRQGTRVLEFDAELRHVATFGRKGGGPGELSQPIGLALGRGDTVWVSDITNRRVTGFPLSGGDPRSMPFPTEDAFPAAGLAADPTGFMMRMEPIFAVTRTPGGGARVSRESDAGDDAARFVPLLRFDGDLAPLDTLWRAPETPMDMVQIEVGQRVMVMMSRREFAPPVQWARLSDGGVVVTDSAAYALHFVAPDGSEQRVVRRDPPPRATTEADREAARERLRDEAGVRGSRIRIGGGGPDPDALRQMTERRVAAMTFSDVIPRVVGLRVDPEDRVWVGVSETTPGEVERIDVYDRDGRLLGETREVPLPDVFLAGDRIGLLRRDSLDVQQVVVLRVTGPAT